MLVSATYFQKKGMNEEAALLFQKVEKSKHDEIVFSVHCMTEITSEMFALSKSL